LCTTVYATQLVGGVLSAVSLSGLSHFVGETAHLQCGEVHQNHVFWYHQLQFGTDISGDHLTNGDRRGRIALRGNLLIIKDVTTSDIGIYTCVEATNGFEVKYQVLLDVTGNGVFSNHKLKLVYST